MKKLTILVLSWLTLGAYAGEKGGGQVEVVERIVAFVNGEIITLGDLAAELSLTRKRLGITARQAEAKEFKLEVLNTMIDNQLIIGYAANQGLHVQERYFEDWKKEVIQEMNLKDERELKQRVELQGTTMAKLRKQFMDAVLIQEIKKRVVQKRVSITKENIEQSYQNRIQEFTPVPKISIREIVIFVGEEGRAEKRLKEVQALLESGLAFAEVAKVHSESGSKSVGGNLGFFSLKELREDFKEALENLGVGEVSKPVQTENAFYLFTIDDKKGGEPYPLEMVEEQITQDLWMKKQTQAIADFLSELREKSLTLIRL